MSLFDLPSPADDFGWMPTPLDDPDAWAQSLGDARRQQAEPLAEADSELCERAPPPFEPAVVEHERAADHWSPPASRMGPRLVAPPRNRGTSKRKQKRRPPPIDSLIVDDEALARAMVNLFGRKLPQSAPTAVLMPHQRAATPSGSPPRVGRYTSTERRERIEKFLAKRERRNFGRVIQYAERQEQAKKQPRVSGRFASR